MGSYYTNIMAMDADNPMPNDERLIKRLAAHGEVCPSLSLRAPTPRLPASASPNRPTQVMYV